MPYISEVTIRLRFQTCEIVDRLIDEGKASNQKSALTYIMQKAKKLTGFNGKFENIYFQYIMFRKTHYKDSKDEEYFEGI